jgi:hypothetical protein
VSRLRMVSCRQYRDWRSASRSRPGSIALLHLLACLASSAGGWRLGDDRQLSI